MTGDFVMKNRVDGTLFQALPYADAGSNSDAGRHHPRYLRMGIFLIFCWMLGSIWLIGIRRSERSIEEMAQRKETVAQVLPEEFLSKGY